MWSSWRDDLRAILLVVAIIVLPWVLIVTGLGGMAVGAFLFGEPHHRTSMERTPPRSLETVVSAQEDYRRHDRDGNGRKDYWRGDVAGLYTRRSADDQPLKLIELSVAAADDRPVTDIETYCDRGPKAGYLYRAILHEDETDPSPDRFAACTFPGVYPDYGKTTWIVDERGTVWAKDLGHDRGVERFPRAPEQADWTPWKGEY